MRLKTAIITGISGQDGSYLAQLLISKDYRVIGVSRNYEESSFFRLSYLDCYKKVIIENTDLTNIKEVYSLIEKYKPEEFYNLSAQSSVGLSFKNPLGTYEFNTISVLNILEAIRHINKKTRFYQASSSEMFGNVSLNNLPIRETHHFNPVSPYGISKASAHWLTVNYREAYGLFASCGILFNHESCLRGENFVIKKIINTALCIRENKADVLTLGNLVVNRDWGYAPKYVEAMWKMLQVDHADDYIICSGNNNSLQEFVVKVFDHLDLDLNKHLRLNQEFMRALDLNTIYGDNSKACELLEWDYDMDTNVLIDRLIKDEIDFISWRRKQK